MRDMQQILRNVLNIIDYKEDKDKFIEEFTDAILQSAFVEIIQALPEEHRRKLLQGAADTISPEAFEHMLSEYVDSKLYKRKVAKAANHIFLDYIQTIAPTLSVEVRSRLQKYMQEQII